jgi:hypothetical protein
MSAHDGRPLHRALLTAKSKDFSGHGVEGVVAVDDLPFTLCAPADRGDPQRERLRCRPERASNGSLDCCHIREVAPDAGPNYLVGTGLTIGVALGQAVEDRPDLLPAAGRCLRPEERDRVIVRPQCLARARVAVLQPGVVGWRIGADRIGGR